MTNGAPEIRVLPVPEIDPTELARPPAVPAETVLPALTLLDYVLGGSGAALEPTRSGREIVLPVPTTVANAPWALAMIVNLIDNADVFARTDPETKLFQRVELLLPSDAVSELPHLHEVLESRKEEARIWARSFAELPDSADGMFPEYGDGRFFEIELRPGAALENLDVQRMERGLERIEEMIAWTAFDTERGPDSYVENGLMFDASFEVTPTTVELEVEEPPTGMALPIQLLVGLLARLSRTEVANVSIVVSDT